MRFPLLRRIISRPCSQAAFSSLLKLCHAGMNYGGGQSVLESGEVGALAYLRNSGLYHPGFRVFDVGANDGQYCETAIRILGPDLEVHSFEPQSSAFASLEKKFGTDTRVHLCKLALGQTANSAQLYSAKEHDTMASLVAQHGAASETVEVSTVDGHCGTHAINRIDLLKIDTEGYEMDVLIGASGMIDRGAVSAIQFEFGDCFIRSRYHFADFMDLLAPRYKIYRILRSGIEQIKGYSPDLEIYKTANFLCVRT